MEFGLGAQDRVAWLGWKGLLRLLEGQMICARKSHLQQGMRYLDVKAVVFKKKVVESKRESPSLGFEPRTYKLSVTPGGSGDSMRLAVLPLHQPGLLVDGRRFGCLSYRVAGDASWAGGSWRPTMQGLKGHYQFYLPEHLSQ
jgi:hypothetical protein